MPTDDIDDAPERPTVREILSANVRRLIDDARETRPQLGSILKVAQESYRRTNGSSTLSKSRVGRIVTGSHPTDIDALTDLAQVFNLEPWQLLVKDLNPKALPRIADAGLLSQIKQIADSVSLSAQHQPPSRTDEQPLQNVKRQRPVKLGPGLSEAFNVKGIDKNAGSTAGAEPKQEGRRRNS